MKNFQTKTTIEINKMITLKGITKYQDSILNYLPQKQTTTIICINLPTTKITHTKT